MSIRWCSPRAFVAFFFYCLQAHPLCWVGLPFTLASIKNKRPMERSPWAFAFPFLLFFLFPQLPTLFSMPLSPPTALGGSLSFTYRLFGSACLNTEELRWGGPTATPPFEPLDLAPKGRVLLQPLIYVFFIRCLCFCLFRVIPCSSVANASAWSYFRGKCFCFILQPSLTHPAQEGNFHRSFLFIKQEWGGANLIATPHSCKRASCSV